MIKGTIQVLKGFYVQWVSRWRAGDYLGVSEYRSDIPTGSHAEKYFEMKSTSRENIRRGEEYVEGGYTSREKQVAKGYVEVEYTS